MFKTCQARVSNKSVLQECFRVLRERVLPKCATRVSHKSVPQQCPTRVCHSVSQKSVPYDCPRRVSSKSVLQEWLLISFNAIQHLLFAFHCSVGTLLLRELLKNVFGFVASIRFLVFFFCSGILQVKCVPFLAAG